MQLSTLHLKRPELGCQWVGMARSLANSKVTTKVSKRDDPGLCIGHFGGGVLALVGDPLAFRGVGFMSVIGPRLQFTPIDKPCT